MRAVALAILATSLSQAAALAADFDPGPLRGTQYVEPVAAPVAIWEGVYFGGFGGYTQTDFQTKSLSTVSAGFVDPLLNNILPLRTKDAHDTAYGGFVGYNTQFEEIVLGVEADYTHARTRGVSFGTSTTPTLPLTFAGPALSEMNDYGTLRVRAGYTAGAFMPFVTGGVALGRASVTYPELTLLGFNPITSTSSVVPLGPKEKYVFGLAAGAGVDFQLMPNVFLRAEYQYVHFDNFENSKMNVHTVRAGAGLKF